MTPQSTGESLKPVVITPVKPVVITPVKPVVMTPVKPVVITPVIPVVITPQFVFVVSVHGVGSSPVAPVVITPAFAKLVPNIKTATKILAVGIHPFNIFIILLLRFLFRNRLLLFATTISIAVPKTEGTAVLGLNQTVSTVYGVEFGSELRA